MNKWQKCLGIVILAAMGCGQVHGGIGRQADQGVDDMAQDSLLKYNGSELVYTSSVSAKKAQELGSYLMLNGFFNERLKTVRINKTANRYEFMFVVPEQYINAQGIADAARIVARDLSADVLNGHPVEVHLCNANMETLRVIETR